MIDQDGNLISPFVSQRFTYSVYAHYDEKPKIFLIFFTVIQMVVAIAALTLSVIVMTKPMLEQYYDPLRNFTCASAIVSILIIALGSYCFYTLFRMTYVFHQFNVCGELLGMIITIFVSSSTIFNYFKLCSTRYQSPQHGQNSTALLGEFHSNCRYYDDFVPLFAFLLLFAGITYIFSMMLSCCVMYNSRGPPQRSHRTPFTFVPQEPQGGSRRRLLQGSICSEEDRRELGHSLIRDCSPNTSSVSQDQLVTDVPVEKSPKEENHNHAEDTVNGETVPTV